MNAIFTSLQHDKTVVQINTHGRRSERAAGRKKKIGSVTEPILLLVSPVLSTQSCARRCPRRPSYTCHEDNGVQMKMRTALSKHLLRCLEAVVSRSTLSTCLRTSTGMDLRLD